MAEIRILPARTRSQLRAMAEVTRRVSDVTPSVDGLEHDLAAEPQNLFLVAYAGSEPVATGVGKPSSIPSCLYAMARVVPERRRRGIGSAVYAALSEHARDIGRSALVGRVREDDGEALAFARRRGFREISRECAVALDLSRADGTPPAPPPGVEIVSLADRPDLVRAAYEVERETLPDIPGDGSLVATPFERWLAGTVEAPGTLLEATVVALVGGEVVGYAGLEQAGRPATAEHLLTAVRRPWRGRGIATALKRTQIAWAKAAGYERLLTSNDEENAPMRAVNARLGYEPEPAWLLMRGPLAPRAGSS